MNIQIYDENDKLITITANIIKGLPGISGDYGQKMTPDDEDEIEIVKSYDENDNDVILTPELYDYAIETILERLHAWTALSRVQECFT